MVADYTIYIDEAGDLGLNRGTRWFVLSAVIIKKENEKNIRQIIEKLKSTLNYKEIHFRKLRHFEKRAYVVNSLYQCPFLFCNVILDTTKVKLQPRDMESNKSVLLYNYMCRFLLERVSWFLRENKAFTDIILSSRGTSRDAELIAYIKDILLKREDNEVAPQFTNVTSKQAPTWDMLQLADVCATSIFMAYEVNKNFGFLLPCYAHKLGARLYKYNKTLKNYGIKYFSPEMEPPKDYFQNNSPCLKA